MKAMDKNMMMDRNKVFSPYPLSEFFSSLLSETWVQDWVIKVWHECQLRTSRTKGFKFGIVVSWQVHRACVERQILELMDHPFLPTLYASFQVDFLPISCSFQWTNKLMILWTWCGAIAIASSMKPPQPWYPFGKDFKGDYLVMKG
jgi:hypothetical protein